METSNHFKNGAILKSHTSRKIFKKRKMGNIFGRISLWAYWKRMIGCFAIGIIVNFVTEEQALITILSFIVSVYATIQGVRRIHDVGKSGWYILVPIYSLILTLSDGTDGDNRYGIDPKKKNSENEFYDVIIIVLFSAFIACGVYALLTITKIITDETIKNIFFVGSFIACYLLFIILFFIDETKKVANQGSKNPPNSQT